jgi:ABC-type transport system involved in multi-copper enzyme maturation permease subunit
VVFTQIIALLLMAPVFSAGSITIEKEQRTLTGLLTSLLSITQIWWGKFVAALLYLLLLLLSALPMLALSFAFGGVEPLQLVRATGSTVLVLAAICCVGLWCSATFRRSIHSTAACYGIVLVLSVVTAVVFGILVSHWSNHHSMLMRGGEGPPAYVQAPLFLNPLYPLLSMMDDADFREFVYPTSSWMLFSAMGCLAAAFAMRRLKRGGDQL